MSSCKDFSTIVGNEGLKTLISAHIRNKTLSHAYIIDGPKGSGKHTIAKEICKALCCESKGTALPCHSCRSCRRVEEGYNTDIYILDRKDKASISVQDVREMTATLGYYPDDGDTKIYIIDNAEKMTPQAQNALLLSLEEPPAYVVFLLLTEDAKLLLETVRSRAQILKTEVFSTQFTASWLANRPECKGAAKDEINGAATVSRGSLGIALETLSDKNSRSRAICDDAKKLVELMVAGNKADCVLFASQIKYQRAEFEEFFDYCLFAIRDLLALKFNNACGLCYADNEEALALSQKVKLTKLSRIYDAFISAKDDITKNNSQVYAVMTTLAASV